MSRVESTVTLRLFLNAESSAFFEPIRSQLLLGCCFDVWPEKVFHWYVRAKSILRDSSQQLKPNTIIWTYSKSRTVWKKSSSDSIEWEYWDPRWSSFRWASWKQTEHRQTLLPPTLRSCLHLVHIRLGLRNDEDLLEWKETLYHNYFFSNKCIFIELVILNVLRLVHIVSKLICVMHQSR